jgi:hypothetical protein
VIRARREARSVTVLLLALVVVLSFQARGAPAAGDGAAAARRPRVLLLSVTADDPLAGRVAAELQALGLEVVRAVIAPTLTIEDQVRQAFAAGARAAVVADGHRTEFWIAEEGTDRVALRQELEIESSPGLESVLSLRTVEFLRVSLGLATELETPPRPPPPPPPGASPRAESERRFSVELASGILASTGRLGPFATVAAGFRARLLGPFGLELVGYAPLATETVGSAIDGQVETSVWLAGGGVTVASDAERRVSLEAGGGLMAVIVRGVGARNAASQYFVVGADDHAVGAAFYGRAGARLRFASRWALRLDVTGGSTALRYPTIVVLNGDTLTRWGAAFVAGLGGVETRF